MGEAAMNQYLRNSGQCEGRDKHGTVELLLWYTVIQFSPTCALEAQTIEAGGNLSCMEKSLSGEEPPLGAEDWNWVVSWLGQGQDITRNNEKEHLRWGSLFDDTI